MRLPAAVLLLLAAAPLSAQIISIPLGGPKKEKPSPNRDLLGSPAGVAAAVAMRGRPAAMTRLDDARHPAEVLTFLGLPLAARVLDVEVDTGYYGEIIGSAVGAGGKVTMLIPPAAMNDAGRRAALIELVGRTPNVALVAATPAKAVLAPASFDFVLLHHLGAQKGASAEAAAFARKLYASVRPGGVVGVIDAVAGRAGDARGGAAALTPDLVHAGFVVDAESRLVPHRVAGDDAGPDGSDGAAPDGVLVRFVKPE